MTAPMNNLLFLNKTTQSPYQFVECTFDCWVLRAEAEDKNLNQYFAQQGVLLPAPTQLITLQYRGSEIIGLGISTDESWWLRMHNEPHEPSEHDFISQLKYIVQDYNQQKRKKARTLAVINQSAAYKCYQLSGTKQSATQLLTHLVAYDWYGLQSRLQQSRLQKNTTGQSLGNVISTLMQSVPIVIYASADEGANHHYNMLIRHSFSDYAVNLIQHTAYLIA